MGSVRHVWQIDGAGSGIRKSGDRGGGSRCGLRRRQLRLRADGANQVEEKPESDKRRQRDRQRDELAIVD